MGRRPCCEKVGLNRGGWTAFEDQTLIAYIKANGEGKWRDLPKLAGLKRCGKSCRLRWLNYLNPEIRRGNITPEEEDIIITLHKHFGNRWSLIAGRLPGRTDNEIKNYWNTILYKKVQAHGQPSSTVPKRKSRKKSNDQRNSTHLQDSASPTPIPIPYSMQSQVSRTETMDETIQNIESGNKCLDIDDYLQFLLNEDTNTLSWEEDVYEYQRLHSEVAYTTDDPVFDYWRETIFMEENSTSELGKLDAFFETQQLPCRW